MRALTRIRGIYLRPREKRAPLPEWESALDEFLSTVGEVCPLPGELASTLFHEAVFCRAERAKHAAEKSVNHVTRRGRQAADYRERQLKNRIRQAETELAFRTLEAQRGWFAVWCDSVPENDQKNMIAAWARRFLLLSGLETLQPYTGDVACEVVSEIHLRSLRMDSAQKGMNRWLVANKLTARNILSRNS